jgi:hypothetical protein
MSPSPRSASRRWLPWALAAAGLLLVDVALARYTSFSDRRILGRWSPAHFGLIVVVTGAIGLALYRSLRAWAQAGAPARSPGARLSAGLALLVWGLGLAVASLSDPGVGGRIVDMRLLSSTTPIPILLEGVTLALAVVAVTVWLWRVVSDRLPPASRLSRLSRNVLVSFVSVAATLLVLEAVCRVMVVAAPRSQGFPTRAQTLWIQRHVRLNSLGYRDVERALTPPAGQTRILLVGDSFGHGLGIDDVRHRVSNRLEDELNQGPRGRRFEVINAARPDTHTVDQIAALPKLLAYKPAYVLLLYVFNDIQHVVPPTRSVVSDPNSLVGRLHPLRLLVLNSALAEQVFVRLHRSPFWNRGPVADPYMDDRILQEHLAALGRFFRVCREAGAEARLIPFDLRVVLAPSFVARYQRLERGAQARGIPVWSLEHAFDRHPDTSLIVNDLDHHPNELANQLAARVIVDRIRAEFDRSEPASR